MWDDVMIFGLGFGIFDGYFEWCYVFVVLVCFCVIMVCELGGLLLLFVVFILIVWDLIKSYGFCFFFGIIDDILKVWSMMSF